MRMLNMKKATMKSAVMKKAVMMIVVTGAVVGMMPAAWADSVCEMQPVDGHPTAVEVRSGEQIVGYVEQDDAGQWAAWVNQVGALNGVYESQQMAADEVCDHQSSE